MSNDHHINVFVSSTYEDLIEYRRVVSDVLVELEFYPVMMEYWPAMDVHAVEKCMREIDKSSIYIGIFAHRYGYCPEGSNISITEMEFERATKKGLTRLCFMVDQSEPWPPEYIEDEPGKSKLHAFRSKINGNLLRGQFTTPDSLGLQVAKALAKPGINLQIGPYTAYNVSPPHPVSSVRAKVQIYIDVNITNFDKDTFLNALSGMLGIERSEIEISRVSSGSTIAEIELPLASALLLHERAFQNRDNNSKRLGKNDVSLDQKHIYISFQRKSSDFVHVLSTRLKENGFNTWLDETILPGEDWQSIIDQAIQDAWAIIVVMTPEARASEFVTYEWSLALGLGKITIPIMLQPTDIHPRLAQLQYLDFTNVTVRPWERLIGLLKDAMEESGSSPDEISLDKYVIREDLINTLAELLYSRAITIKTLQSFYQNKVITAEDLAVIQEIAERRG